VNHGCDYITGRGGGVIQGTASEAVLVVLLAARDKILRTVGRSALPKLVTYASDQVHSSLQKAVQVWLVTHKIEMPSCQIYLVHVCVTSESLPPCGN
jgi:glutamate/tyrosine decarboxylase-like PLP-dependent enzyme